MRPPDEPRRAVAVPALDMVFSIPEQMVWPDELMLTDAILG